MVVLLIQHQLNIGRHVMYTILEKSHFGKSYRM
jgi:hypothetical protein